MFSTQHLPADDERLPAMYKAFERNLNRIIDAGERRGARVILCTVAVNVRDSAPFGSRVGSSLDPAARALWESHFEDGIAAQAARRFDDAQRAYAAAIAIDDHYAELLYRYGQVLDELGEYESAVTHFAWARDLDTQRFRADTEINRPIRETASRRSVTLIDLEQALDSAPGSDHFIDHVHFTAEGVDAIGRAIAAALTQDPRFADQPDSAELKRRLFFTPWGERRQVSVMLQRRTEPPFATQWGNADHVRALRSWSECVARDMDGTSLDAVEQWYLRARREYPHDHTYAALWGQALAATGEWNRAADVLVQAIGDHKGFTDMHNLAALALCQAGHPSDAASLLLRSGPPYGHYLVDSVLLLAETLEQGGRRDQAEQVARSVLEQTPRFPGRDVVEQWLRRRP